MAATLPKASEDTFNSRGWLILKDIINKWVVEGVTSDLHDITFMCHWVGYIFLEIKIDMKSNLYNCVPY
jgi:hypothetical protein